MLYYRSDPDTDFFTRLTVVKKYLRIIRKFIILSQNKKTLWSDIKKGQIIGFIAYPINSLF